MEPSGVFRCELCPHRCRIADGHSGLCKTRGVRDGKLLSLGYGKVSSAHLDPIEKKPLNHYHPGSTVFSIGGWGCNFACSFCQNWSISQTDVKESDWTSPADITSMAISAGALGIAYTYNEPLVGLEFVMDCCREAHAQGLRNVLVTNGYINPAPAGPLLGMIEAMNVDIKSMDDEFYRRHCHGTLQPVLDFCCQAVGVGCHVEITNLIIPGLNDSDAGFRRLSSWIARHLGHSTALHLTAYRPQYKMEIASTPVQTLERAYAVCRESLPHVYIGNVRVNGIGEDTHCAACDATLVERRGYTTRIKGLRRGCCATCGATGPIICC
jgi:pyruvate formate lyase activating enzyme